jgi:7-cyano-7-deazaguanine reductase
MPARRTRPLVTFANPRPQREYVIRHECPEYTALCPVTGQPDFGTVVIVYAPGRRCLELKSLKLYLGAFRDEGHYYEQVTNQILDDLVRACRPRWMTVIGRFNVRGGIGSTVVARHPDSRPGRPAGEGARRSPAGDQGAGGRRKAGGGARGAGRARPGARATRRRPGARTARRRPR